MSWRRGRGGGGPRPRNTDAGPFRPRGSPAPEDTEEGAPLGGCGGGGGGGGGVWRLLRSIGRLEGGLEGLRDRVREVAERVEGPEGRTALHASFPLISSTLSQLFNRLASTEGEWEGGGEEETVALVVALHSAMQPLGGGEGGQGQGHRVHKVTEWLIASVASKSKRWEGGRPKHLHVLHHVFTAFMDTLGEEDSLVVSDLLFHAVEKADNATAFRLFATLFAHAIKDLGAKDHPSFQDFVDLVIGWMVDEEGREDVSGFCGGVLLLLRPRFLELPTFPVALINQLLEDLESQALKVQQLVEGSFITPAPQTTHTNALLRIVLLLKAYVAMLSLEVVGDRVWVGGCTERVVEVCLRVLRTPLLLPRQHEPPNYLGLIEASLNLVGENHHLAFHNHSHNHSHNHGFELHPLPPPQEEEEEEGGRKRPPEVKEALLQVFLLANEAFSLSPAAEGPAINNFIKVQMDLFIVEGGWLGWPEMVKGRVWEALCCWTETAVSSTHLTPHVEGVVTSLMKFIDQAPSSREKVVLVQTLFRTRNLPLLQRLYNWHLAKVGGGEGEEAPTDPPSSKPIDPNRNESLLYVVAGLSDLASNRSILTQWALSPPIVEVLTRLGGAEGEGPTKDAILTLLKMHAAAHAHWVSACASTPTSEFATESPSTRFLPLLLEYWLSELVESHLRMEVDGVERRPYLMPKPTRAHWILSWVLEFLGGGVALAMANPLFATSPPFFSRLLHFVCFGLKTSDRKDRTLSSEPPDPQQEAMIRVNEMLLSDGAGRAPWPYLKEATQLLALFNEGEWLSVDGLVEEVGWVCQWGIGLGGEVVGGVVSPFRVHPAIRTLLLTTLCRHQGFLLSQKPLPPEPRYSVLSWAQKMSEPILVEDDFSDHFTEAEFTAFLWAFLTEEEGEEEWVGPSPERVMGAVDYAVRSRFKTLLGKPLQLFGHIQTAIKRRTATLRRKNGGKNPLDLDLDLDLNFEEGGGAWRLHFMFALEQAFSLYIEGGSLAQTVPLKDAPRAFFTTNRAPCLEWWKRVRGDLLEAALEERAPYDAYYHASMSEDVERAKVALLHICDAEGLHGESLWERAGALYAQGRFQHALKLIEEANTDKDEEVDLGPLAKAVGDRCVAILAMNEPVHPYSGDPERLPLHILQHLAPSPEPATLLSAQLEQLVAASVAEPRIWDAKRYVTSLLKEEDEGEGLPPWTGLQLSMALRKMMRVPMDDKLSANIEIARTMAALGNHSWVEGFLTTCGLKWEALTTDLPLDLDMDLGLDDLFRGNLVVPPAAAASYMTWGQGSAASYGYMTWGQGNAASRGDSITKHLTKRDRTLSALLLLASSHFLQKGEEGPLPLLYNTLLKHGGPKGEVVAEISEQLEVVKGVGRLFPLLRSQRNTDLGHNLDPGDAPSLLFRCIQGGILERALEEKKEDHHDHGLWAHYGNYLYETCGVLEGEEEGPDKADDMKERALSAYSSHLNQSAQAKGGGAKSRALTVRVIARIILLLQRGIISPTFEWESLLGHTPLWLHFLPAIAQMPPLRPLVLKKFPREAAMYLWALCDQGPTHKTRISLASLGRRQLFDPCATATVEVNEESYSHVAYLPPSAPCPTCVEAEMGVDRDSPYLSRGPHPLQATPNINKLATELLRLATTPEELWAWNLQRVVGEWRRRLSWLRREVRGGGGGSGGGVWLSLALHPLIVFLRELWEGAVGGAEESPAAARFLLHAAPTLPRLIRGLETATTLEGALPLFEQLLRYAQTLDSYNYYKTPLAEVSPWLSALGSEEGRGLWVGGMPEGVCLIGLAPQVYSLPTKTKPKKVRLLGSDGRHYDYLVKGLENLNVDAGMMQFLEVTGAGFLPHPTRPYAVTPLGNRGGLIQMVGGAAAVFQLYKKWNQRNGFHQRTSSLFWGRVEAAAGGHAHSNRDKVEDHTLLKVFSDLKDSSPKNLISREVLLSSGNSREWFHTTKNLTRDVGVGCGIGWLLGVGDRHLDNILLDVGAGRVVHVDFSLVFGRGASLRVPETVPFRLTQNFVGALQFPPTGPSSPLSAYLGTTLQAYKDNQELATFCARSIAFASQMEEELMVDPLPLRKAEVSATLALLLLRYNTAVPLIHQLKPTLLSLVEEAEGLRGALEEVSRGLAARAWTIEALTITLSKVKEAEGGEGAGLGELRTQVTALMMETTPTTLDPLSMQGILVGLERRLNSDPALSDADWGLLIEKGISATVQAEVQAKFLLNERAEQGAKRLAELNASIDKQMNKCRRALGSLDPLLTFLARSTSGAAGSRFAGFKALVEEQWVGVVAHFWLHPRTPLTPTFMKQRLMEFPAIAELTEVLLQEILCSLAPFGVGVGEEETTPPTTTTTAWGGRNHTPTSSPPLPLLVSIEDGEVAPLDESREWVGEALIATLLDKFTTKVDAFHGASTVEGLVAEATDEGNLSKMFEGWTAWI